MKLAVLLLMTAAGVLQPQEITRVRAPRVIHKVDPEYTREALGAKVQGVVILSLLVGADGVPSEIGMVRGLGSGLDEKAVECLKQWRFSPALDRNGEPKPVKATVEINFQLPQPSIVSEPRL